MDFAIFFHDDRLADIDLTSEERVGLLLELIQRGSFDLRDSSISNMTVVEVSDCCHAIKAIAA